MAASLAQWMRTNGVRRSVRVGQTLTCRGERPDWVFLVDRGVVVLHYEANGNRFPISVCSHGAVIGLGAAILDRPHAADARPRVDADVVAVAADSVRALITSPEYSVPVARSLAAETFVLANRCAALQSQTVRSRVLTILSELSYDASVYPVALVLPIQDLATMAGADLAHVCRVLRGLRDEGLIDYGKRRLAIHTPIRACGLRP